MKVILETFYPILRFQFLYALLWRQSYGKLRQPPPSTLADLEAFQLSVKEDSYLLDLYTQIELHTMRKLFLTVYVLRKSYAVAEADDVILSKVISQTNDFEELQIIIEYLGLAKKASQSACQLDDEIWVGDTAGELEFA